MKKLIVITTLAIACLTQAKAQTETPTSNFFQTTMGYFTSFNTNIQTFRADTIDVSAGTDNINNGTMAASLSLEVNILKLSTVTNVGYLGLGVNSVTRNAGINGIIIQQQGGLELSKTYYDVKGSVYVDGGYDFQKSKWYPCVGVVFKKALTDNTFAYIGLEENFMYRAPTYSVGVGFKF